MSENSLTTLFNVDEPEQTLGEYNGVKIDLCPADRNFVNATQMCKAAGKRFNDFHNNDGTQEYIQALSLITRIPVIKLIYSTRGRYGGTWVHKDIGTKLAGWCCPQFEVWYIQKVNQLLETGKVLLPREHQEAELATLDATSVGQSMLFDLLQEVRRSHDLTERGLEANSRAYRLTYDLLKELNSRPRQQLERAVEMMLVRAEGGQRQVPIGDGHRIDVLTDAEVIEVKHHKDYKTAVGQVALYEQLLTNRDKRIHLFAKPYEKVKRQRVSRIKTECRRVGVRVTWHKWDNIQPDLQQRLELEWDDVDTSSESPE